MTRVDVDLAELIEELSLVRADLIAADIRENDVRLQVLHGTWYLHSGDPSFDTDHRGVWGASEISAFSSDEDLRFTAIDLIEQAAEQAEETY